MTLFLISFLINYVNSGECSTRLPLGSYLNLALVQAKKDKGVVASVRLASGLNYICSSNVTARKRAGSWPPPSYNGEA